MPRMLDVSDDVRAEIGDEEADRLLAGENAPGAYDCTSCRTPGNTDQERTSTVLFVGQETAVLAFAHATCVPSQVVPVAEEQLRGAVRSITGEDTADPLAEAVPHGVSAAPQYASAAPSGYAGAAQPRAQAAVQDPPQQPGRAAPSPQAVLGVTSGVVLVGGEARPALVVEPTAPITRPGSGQGDDFLSLLTEQGFLPVVDLNRPPGPNHGWSVLIAMGQLHAVLMPSANGGAPVAWWQAHRPMPLSEGWRNAANRSRQVMIYAAPAGTIGTQPREDQLRAALDRAAASGALVGASMPLAGT
ncbi:hypothetical protein HUT19_31655 [Streptomyces sp. NA02950]|uniref:hypothetical protein n=1 Tax=Streptomyces sp. NA02950 TaxID=2742137 RepID=UPI0015903523|nr:hypothetical protein [Streptomyces sp. NA02950]QKV95737.1 hypothetical protein HUT19_31655 [Streptomyces sp. NA02950]